MSEPITDKEINALISLLDDNDDEIISIINDKIISIGDRIVPFLEKEWEENFNPIVQSRIEELVHKVQFSTLKNKLFNWKNSSNQDLLEGLWLTASYLYPDIDLDALYNKINLLWHGVKANITNDMSPEQKIKVLNDYFFKEQKFTANTKNFHSPSNSMINIVLDTHRGNPISLCIVYMMIANRLQIPLFGVNLPNLFVLTYKSGEHQFYINVFNRGLIFSKKDISAYIEQLKLDSLEAYFEPCSNKDIVVRNFRNLIVAYEKLSEKDKIAEIQELMDIITK